MLELLSSLTWQEVLPVLGPTGLVAVYLIWKTHNEKTLIKAKSDADNAPANFTEAQTAFNASIMKRLDKLEEMNATLIEENNDLKIRIERLLTKLSMFESSHTDSPLPMWTKDRHGIMLALNDAYEALFLSPMGHTREDYIGKTDQAVWGKEISARFVANDKHVMSTGRVSIFKEVFPINGSESPWYIIKYPRYIGTNGHRTAIGVAGIACPQEAFLEVIGDVVKKVDESIE